MWLVCDWIKIHFDIVIVIHKDTLNLISGKSLISKEMAVKEADKLKTKGILVTIDKHDDSDVDSEDGENKSDGKQECLWINQ